MSIHLRRHVFGFSNAFKSCGIGVKKPVQLQRRNLYLTRQSKLRQITSVDQSVDVDFDEYVPELKDLLGNTMGRDYFNLKNKVAIRELFDARVHFGHNKGCRNEHMEKYLFGCRNGVDIFDLEKTQELMFDALNVLAHVVYKGGKILFLMHSHKHGHQVEKCAQECDEYAHTRKWFLSTFTDPESQNEPYPDMCIFLSTQDTVTHEHHAVIECAKLSILTTAIVDSNVNPTLITYPIPGNDDTVESINLYLKLFKETILTAKEKRNQHLERKGK